MVCGGLAGLLGSNFLTCVGGLIMAGLLGGLGRIIP